MLTNWKWAALIALACATPAWAWEPTKPIEINVPTTPGGSVDRTARLILGAAGLPGVGRVLERFEGRTH